MSGNVAAALLPGGIEQTHALAQHSTLGKGLSAITCFYIKPAISQCHLPLVPQPLQKDPGVPYTSANHQVGAVDVAAAALLHRAA